MLDWYGENIHITQIMICWVCLWREWARALVHYWTVWIQMDKWFVFGLCVCVWIVCEIVHFLSNKHTIYKDRQSWLTTENDELNEDGILLLNTNPAYLLFFIHLLRMQWFAPKHSISQLSKLGMRGERVNSWVFVVVVVAEKYDACL